jgi:hypothetical protein
MSTLLSLYYVFNLDHFQKKMMKEKRKKYCIIMLRMLDQQKMDFWMNINVYNMIINVTDNKIILQIFFSFITYLVRIWNSNDRNVNIVVFYFMYLILTIIIEIKNIDRLIERKITTNKN